MSYLAQVSLYWLLLYGCYWLVLRRHTFFAWNRAYLLGSLLGAFALPLVPYPEVAPPVPMIVYEVATLPTESVFVATSDFAPQPATPATAEPFPWVAMLGLVYALGVGAMAIRLFRHLRQIRAYIRRGTCLEMDAYRLCILGNDQVGVGSFSFLNHIVLNHTDYEHNFDTILNHELAHVRQRHSWDILLVEVLRVIFWFNPVLILYKRSLQQVHEYLADREVCEWQAAPERDCYAEFMVSYALGSTMATLVNPFFNSSLLKDRIVMLYKNRNSNWSLGKYAAVALLVGFVSLLAASCEQKANEKSGTEENTAVADKALLIEGTVKDTEGTPLSGAVISVKGTQTGTTTTTQGQFRILVPADSELDFSFVSHKTASVQVKQQGTIDVTLARTRSNAASVARWVSSDTGNVFAQRVKTELLPNYVTDSVYTVVKQNPVFPGGLKAMYQYIQDNIKYPAAARRALVEGKVFLSFVVNSDGSIQNIQVLKGLGFACDEEAIRVVSAMPKWIPGEKANGEKVNVKYNLPISFVLPEKELSSNARKSKPKATTAVQRTGVNAEADSLIGLKFHKPDNSEDSFDENPKKEYRGQNFMASTEPLYVLDGVVAPIENPTHLRDVNPSDIVSLNIIKDDAAKVKYGIRAANGAVEINTKQGVKMPLNIKK